MYQVKEKDWKQFRKMLPELQEAYMERLTKEYIELLSSDMQASDKFWALDKRIKDDKKCTGVIARDISRSHMFQHIIDLMYEGAITVDDLRQYRTEIVPQLRSRFFCQIVSEYRRNTDVFQGIMVQADGKRSSRCGAEP